MSAYITAEQLADYLNIDDADDDTELTQAINASSAAIDAWCQRSFSSDVSASARVYCAESYGYVCVDDFSTTSGLVVKTDEGDNGTYGQTWTYNTDYLAAPFNREVDGMAGWPYDRIVATGNRWFLASYFNRPRIQVTALWGWAAVPDAVVQATFIKAARIFRRSLSPESQGGFDGGSGFSVPLVRVNAREDPDVTALLAPYRRLSLTV